MIRGETIWDLFLGTSVDVAATAPSGTVEVFFGVVRNKKSMNETKKNTAPSIYKILKTPNLTQNKLFQKLDSEKLRIWRPPLSSIFGWLP